MDLKEIHQIYAHGSLAERDAGSARGTRKKTVKTKRSAAQTRKTTTRASTGKTTGRH